MLNARWLIGLALVAWTAFTGCTTKTSLGQAGEDAGGGRDAQLAPGCTYQPVQVNLSCNDDPNLPWSAGICETDGTCFCTPGFVLNPVSKRCKLDTTVDAGLIICTVGVDQSCTDKGSPTARGTCVGGVACACKTGFLVNPANGLCMDAPAADAGAGADSGPSGLVCTALLNQTCNDDDLFSGTAGACTKSGTCACNPGYVINPATGRCRAVPAPDAGSTGDKGVAADAAVDADGGASKDTGRDVVDAPVGKDTGKDSAGVCTPGMNQTCNDSLVASDVAGTCQSDGTCVCGTGHVLNPSSGRCADVPRDAGPDVTTGADGKTACTPGMDQTCNDSPASALWGTCKANGTCSCNSGYVMNASTGRCMYPATAACPAAYDACGCGCCGGTNPKPVCYYPSAGDSLATIIANDQTARSSSTCTAMGCTQGERYLCCTEAAPNPADNGQYKATYTAGGYDRIGLTRVGVDNICMAFNLVQSGLSGSSPSKLRVTTPANWLIDGSNISMSSCNLTTSTNAAIGAQGTVTFSPNGSSCALNVHMTVFFAETAYSPVTAVRIDADNVAITGGPTGFCQ